MAKGHTFTMERLVEIFEGAFAPLKCLAEWVNYGNQITFEVRDGTKTLVKGSVASGPAQKDYNLRTQITRARRDVEAQDGKLDPWEMPSA